MTRWTKRFLAPPRWSRIAAIVSCGVVLFLIYGIWFHVPMMEPNWAKIHMAHARFVLKDIVDLEREYFAKHGEYLPIPPTPTRRPGPKPMPWSSEDHARFRALGFRQGGFSSPCTFGVSVERQAFTAVAACQTYGDGNTDYIGYVAAPVGEIGVVGPFGRCSSTGVLVGEDRCATNTFGPCDAESRAPFRIHTPADGKETRECRIAPRQEEETAQPDAGMPHE